MNKIKLLILFILISTNNIQAQLYDGTPCESEHLIENNRRNIFNNTLESGLAKLKIETPYSMNSTNYVHFSSSWSSSMRKPDGKAPVKTTSTYYEGIGKYTSYDPSYIRFSCKYSPFYAIDGKTDTAWSEGTDDDGENEFIIVPIKNFSNKIKIFPVFGANKKLFFENNRPKNISIYILIANEKSEAQDSIFYENFILIDLFNFELIDNFGFQSIDIPEHIMQKYSSYITKKNVIQDPVFISIKINSVYKGSKYSDTLISEIMSE